MRWMALVFAVSALAGAAWAQDAPRFCPNRPDLGSSTCTVEPGRLLAEVSSADWQRERSDGERTDTFLAGDLLLRTGLGARTEVQLSWTPVAQVRTYTAGAPAEVVTGVGDVRLGLRRNLRHPDGGGFSIAVEPFVTLPVGTGPIGRGDWSAGVVVPVSYDLDAWSLGFTGEVDAETDGDRSGRHRAFAGTLGLGRAFSDRFGGVVEVSARRDEDPGNRHTEWVAAASVAWTPGDTLQLDLLGVAGLNRSAPDFRLVAGVAVLF